MSALTLTKNYGDLTLLFKADIDGMWTELETKINGNIDSDNVASGWASFNQVTLSKDVDYKLGATNSAYMYFSSSTNEFVFAHVTTNRSTLFKIAGTTVGTLDESANLSLTQDVYFYNSSTVYPLSYLIGYSKPVLVYVDSTTINVEQNTGVASRTLIVFPSGPIAVTEDVSTTNKFRQIKISVTANGYLSSHTGDADSGMKVGLSLTANTWYFVYAVKVVGGNDAGNNFVLVVDSVNPSPTNWSTLDSSYTAGNWIYLGLFRYGHGGASTTTMIPFIQDHQGWHSFTGKAASTNFFGIRVDSSTISSTSYSTLFTATGADSGNAAPTTCSVLRITYRPIADGDGDLVGHVLVSDSSDVVLLNLPSFAMNDGAIAHGFMCKVPNIGAKVKAKRGGSLTDDYAITTYISAVLDEWV